MEKLGIYEVRGATMRLLLSESSSEWLELEDRGAGADGGMAGMGRVGLESSPHSSSTIKA